MIIKKDLLKKVKKDEDIFRQIAEEKPYLIYAFNEKKFHKEAEHILNKKIPFRYVQYWLSGYRRRKNPE